MKRSIFFVLTVVLVVVFSQATAEAQVCGTINGLLDPPGPTFGNYLDGTRRCSLGTPGQISAECTDSGGVQATFTPALSVRRIGMGWATWSDPPFSEESIPVVGFTGVAGHVLDVTLVTDTRAVGFEVEPNQFAFFDIRAEFMDVDGNVLVTLTQNVEGRAGARLFAAVCRRHLIHSLRITADAAAQGFAIAQLRSEQFAGMAGSEERSQGRVPVPQGATSNAID